MILEGVIRHHIRVHHNMFIVIMPSFLNGILVIKAKTAIAKS
jgi:hypothetical protein